MKGTKQDTEYSAALSRNKKSKPIERIKRITWYGHPLNPFYPLIGAVELSKKLC